MKLNYFKVYSDVENLNYATDGSACFDLCAYLNTDSVSGYNKRNQAISLKVSKGNLIIPPRSRVLVPTGLIFDIPAKHHIKLHVRSSIGYKTGLSIPNSTGIIDSDYIDQVSILLYNMTDSHVEIGHLQRICQGELVRSLQPKLLPTMNPPKKKTKRMGGIGSTGQK